MTRLANQRGTTLMELMVYLAISTVVVLSMTTFVTALTKTRVRTTDQQIAQAEARNVIERMTHTIRNSRDVAVTGARIDATDETGLVTSYCGCDGTIKSGQHMAFPPAGADLEPAIESGVQVDNFTLERLGSSVRVSLNFSKNGQSAALVSTIAFRQAP
ncbi:MAG: prepilin-type N-terminal cleavage/methylation domain-containing protein [Candidatus Kerfeldbacteria bacterium]|nr:prepilin-type N-terminal cleavage/methylation domain-containing protein [Candidatus Kerfeldbacteria bacterium]